jgi:hypothetical protein
MGRGQSVAARYRQKNPKLAQRIIEVADLVDEETADVGTVPLREALQALDALGTASLSEIATSMPNSDEQAFEVNRALALVQDSIFAMPLGEHLWTLTYDGQAALNDA